MLVDRELAYHASFILGDYCPLKWKSECCPLTCSPSKGSYFGYCWKDNGGVSKRKKDEQGNPKKVNPRRSVVDAQITLVTQLKKQLPFLKEVNSTVLQQVVRRVDDAFKGFFEEGRGYPNFKNRSNFKSFQYATGVIISGSKIYLPGIGWMRFYKSRELPAGFEIKTVTIRCKQDGWYVSLRLEDKSVPDFPIRDVSEINTAVGLDMGLGKLVYCSDGAVVINPRFGTDKKAKKTLKIRARNLSRKKKGSKKRKKAGKRLGKYYQKITQKREAYQWKVANKIVRKADAVIVEDLNIVGMIRRCKPKTDENGKFVKNGQTAKRSLNRLIADASWGNLISKLEYLAVKQGKRLFKVNPKNTSQQCSVCGYIDADNRDGEKFICLNCGHVDDANLQAARNIKVRGVEQYGLVLKTRPRKVKIKVWQDLPEPKQLCLFEMPTPEITGGKKRYRGTRNASKRQELGNQMGVQQLTLFDMDMLESSRFIRQNPLTSS
jgi:putative transposase